MDTGVHTGKSNDYFFRARDLDGEDGIDVAIGVIISRRRMVKKRSRTAFVERWQK